MMQQASEPPAPAAAPTPAPATSVPTPLPVSIAIIQFAHLPMSNKSKCVGYCTEWTANNCSNLFGTTAKTGANS